MSDHSSWNDLTEPSADQLAAVAESADRMRSALVILVGDGDKSGTPAHFSQDTDKLITELLLEADFTTDAVVRVGPKRSHIREAIQTGVVGGADLVLTIGGVGVGPRNKTPDATRDMLDQILPGIGQALRASALGCGAIDASVSRGIAGVSGSTVIVNLAPSRAAIRDGMATLGPLVHFVVDQLQKWSCD